jgi:hypothetical protein
VTHCYLFFFFGGGGGCGREGCVLVCDPSTGGVVQTRNFPDDYDGSISCVSSLSVSAGRGIQLTFTHFNLAPADYVYVSNTSNHLFHIGRVSWGAIMTSKWQRNLFPPQIYDGYTERVMGPMYGNQITPFVVNTSTSLLNIKIVISSNQIAGSRPYNFRVASTVV